MALQFCQPKGFTKNLYGAAAIGIFVSFMKDRPKTRLALKKAWKSFENILPSVLAVLLLIGFILALLDEQVYSLEHAVFPFHYEERLQQVFRFAALVPSLKDGLIPADGVTISGDGTCVHFHASPHGHKVCNCCENGIFHCSCNRHFSDPDAHWGWDSDEEIFYFGHPLYMLCSHNAHIGIDLPLHIRFPCDRPFFWRCRYYI